MEASSASHGDPKLIEAIVNRLKSQGVFDQLRKDCIADVDTRPAYQNLRQRVESYAEKFVQNQNWSPDLNKNQLRNGLRRELNETGILTSGVDRVVEQIVNPKIFKVFKPEIEKVVCEYLNIDPKQRESREKRRQEIQHQTMHQNMENLKENLKKMQQSPQSSSSGSAFGSPGFNQTRMPYFPPSSLPNVTVPPPPLQQQQLFGAFPFQNLPPLPPMPMGIPPLPPMPPMPPIQGNPLIPVSVPTPFLTQPALQYLQPPGTSGSPALAFGSMTSIVTSVTQSPAPMTVTSHVTLPNVGTPVQSEAPDKTPSTSTPKLESENPMKHERKSSESESKKGDSKKDHKNVNTLKNKDKDVVAASPKESPKAKESPNVITIDSPQDSPKPPEPMPKPEKLIDVFKREQEKEKMKDTGKLGGIIKDQNKLGSIKREHFAGKGTPKDIPLMKDKNVVKSKDMKVLNKEMRFDKLKERSKDAIKLPSDPKVERAKEKMYERMKEMKPGLIKEKLPHKSEHKHRMSMESEKYKPDTKIKKAMPVDIKPEKTYRFAWESQIRDLDEDQLSDVTISSVHTDDLSEFDVSTGESESESQESKDITQKKSAFKNEKSPMTEVDEESTRNLSKEKGNRYLSRQERRAQIEAKIREIEEKKKQLKEQWKKRREMGEKADVSVKETVKPEIKKKSVQRQKMSKQAKEALKEQLKEQKVMEKRMALRRQRTRNPRYENEEFISIFTEKRHKSHLASLYDEPAHSHVQESKTKPKLKKKDTEESLYESISDSSQSESEFTSKKVKKTKSPARPPSESDSDNPVPIPDLPKPKPAPVSSARYRYDTSDLYKPRMSLRKEGTSPRRGASPEPPITKPAPSMAHVYKPHPPPIAARKGSDDKSSVVYDSDSSDCKRSRTPVDLSEFGEAARRYSKSLSSRRVDQFGRSRSPIQERSRSPPPYRSSKKSSPVEPVPFSDAQRRYSRERREKPIAEMDFGEAHRRYGRRQRAVSPSSSRSRSPPRGKKSLNAASDSDSDIEPIYKRTPAMPAAKRQRSAPSSSQSPNKFDDASSGGGNRAKSPTSPPAKRIKPAPPLPPALPTVPVRGASPISDGELSDEGELPPSPTRSSTPVLDEPAPDPMVGEAQYLGKNSVQVELKDNYVLLDDGERVTMAAIEGYSSSPAGPVSSGGARSRSATPLMDEPMPLPSPDPTTKQPPVATIETLLARVEGRETARYEIADDDVIDIEIMPSSTDSDDDRATVQQTSIVVESSEPVIHAQEIKSIEISSINKNANTHSDVEEGSEEGELVESMDEDEENTSFAEHELPVSQNNQPVGKVDTHQSEINAEDNREDFAISEDQILSATSCESNSDQLSEPQNPCGASTLEDTEKLAENLDKDEVNEPDIPVSTEFLEEPPPDQPVMCEIDSCTVQSETIEMPLKIEPEEFIKQESEVKESEKEMTESGKHELESQAFHSDSRDAKPVKMEQEKDDSDITSGNNQIDIEPKSTSDEQMLEQDKESIDHQEPKAEIIELKDLKSSDNEETQKLNVPKCDEVDSGACSINLDINQPEEQPETIKDTKGETEMHDVPEVENQQSCETSEKTVQHCDEYAEENFPTSQSNSKEENDEQPSRPNSRASMRSSNTPSEDGKEIKRPPSRTSRRLSRAASEEVMEPPKSGELLSSSESPQSKLRSQELECEVSNMSTSPQHEVSTESQHVLESDAESCTSHEPKSLEQGAKYKAGDQESDIDSCGKSPRISESGRSKMGDSDAESVTSSASKDETRRKPSRYRLPTPEPIRTRSRRTTSPPPSGSKLIAPRQRRLSSPALSAQSRATRSADTKKQPSVNSGKRSSDSSAPPSKRSKR